MTAKPARRRKSPKVVGLHGAIPACGQPDPELIEAVRKLLDKASRGEIIGFAYATVGIAESVVTFWTGKADSHRLVYGAGRLWHRMQQAADEGEL